jgi:hypothetical protein
MTHMAIEWQEDSLSSRELFRSYKIGTNCKCVCDNV